VAPRYIKTSSILVSKRRYSRHLSRYRRYRTALVQIAGTGELRFCSQWAFIYAPLSHVPLCVNWAFLLSLSHDWLPDFTHVGWQVTLCNYRSDITGHHCCSSEQSSHEELYTIITFRKVENVQSNYLYRRSMMSSCNIHTMLYTLHWDTDLCH